MRKTRPADSYWLGRDDNRRRTHYGRRPSRRERSREELLKDWYGPDFASGEIEGRRPPARSIGRVLGEVLSSFGMAEMVRLDEIREQWPELVGEDVAKIARPSSLLEGELVVEVAHAAWLYVLEREHKPRLETAVRDATHNEIHTIRLVPAGRRERFRGPRRYPRRH